MNNYLLAALPKIKNPIIGKEEGEYEIVSQNPLANLLVRAWQTLIIIGGITLLIFLILGALEWLTSEGDQEKLKKARNKITNALIGLILLAASFALINFLIPILGFDILNISWPTPTTP